MYILKNTITYKWGFSYLVMDENQNDDVEINKDTSTMVIISIIIVLVFIFLVWNLMNMPTDCEKSCMDKGYKSGYCVSMANSESCESKSSSLTSPLTTNSLDECRQKQPDGYKNMCCCSDK